MSSLINIISSVLIISGSLAIVVGMLGVFRMPDFFTRLHAASIIDTLGTLFIIFGLMLYSGLTLVSIKLLIIMVFVMVTTPTAAHALAKSALHGKLEPLLEEKET